MKPLDKPLPTQPRDKGRQARCGCLPSFCGPVNTAVAPITGTWDFKWPVAQKIRVRFAPSRNGAVSASVYRTVIELAHRWNGIANIVLDVQAPSRAGQAVPLDEYDVLVSLDPLPNTLERSDNEPKVVVAMPEAQMGTYNRRVDAGRPTVFLGCPAGMPSKNGGVMQSDEYFESGFFRQAVVHEFGHVLGLIHPQQVKGFVALAELQWRNHEEIEPILRAAFGKAAATKDALDSILPPIEGSARYSDYPLEGEESDEPKHLMTPGWQLIAEVAVPPGQSTRTLTRQEVALIAILSSVMAPPLVGCLFVGSTCTADECSCLFTTTEQPSDFDGALLRAMYPGDPIMPKP